MISEGRRSLSCKNSPKFKNSLIPFKEVATIKLASKLKISTWGRSSGTTKRKLGNLNENSKDRISYSTRWRSWKTNNINMFIWFRTSSRIVFSKGFQPLGVKLTSLRRKLKRSANRPPASNSNIWKELMITLFA